MRLRPLAAVLAALTLACPDGKKCPPGQTACGGQCLDLATSPTACGSCDTACPLGASCVAGRCGCPAGQDVCEGTCVDLQSASTHCGQCGIACGAGTCVAGQCVCDAASGVQRCQDGQSPICVDTQSDPASCGQCRHGCALGGVCTAGACGCPDTAPDSCPNPDRCVDLRTNPQSCGSCGNACPLENDVCAGGSCTCPPGLPTTCGSRCVNTGTDPQHCGACGDACPTGATCAGGSCDCPGAQVLCGSGVNAVCSDRVTDPQNCGACGTRCPVGGTCAGGRCSCPPAQPTLCGASPGRCCAGDACCGDGACPPAHQNGLGQAYYDCGAAGAHTLDQARKAALAWSPGFQPIGGASTPCGDARCLCSQRASEAAIWCAAGSNADRAGRVLVTASPNCFAAVCPSAATGLPWD